MCDCGYGEYSPNQAVALNLTALHRQFLTICVDGKTVALASGNKELSVWITKVFGLVNQMVHDAEELDHEQVKHYLRILEVNKVVDFGDSELC